MKDWNTNYAAVPSNYTLLPVSDSSLILPVWIVPDLILSQHKAGQFQIAQNIARQLKIPHISLEHRLPTNKQEAASVQGLLGDTNVFVSEYQAEQWQVDNCEINHTGIDTDLFIPPITPQRQPWALSVVNDWIKRDFHCGFYLWKETVGFKDNKYKHIPCEVLGDTPGLSKPAPDIATLVQYYQKAGVFLNTTLNSSLPTVILEAMSCGCPVVSTGTCLIPKIIIEHGVNGLIGNDATELRQHTHFLLNNPDEAHRIGMAGRKTIEDKFSQKQFVQRWNEIFTKTMDNYK
jgi:glycosyltransferase involved in cell wall biosynthesis